MRSVLVTGGSGAFGTAFVRRLLTMRGVERIAVYSRGEFRQAMMLKELQQQWTAQEIDDRVRMFIGDVRDLDRLKRAMRGVDTVIHAAALKRIEVGNYNPDEMLKTNVMGTQNVVDAAMDAGVKVAVLTSSDKAFQPVSPYGHSKAMAECLFLAANNVRGSGGPRFVATRYGNVWRSTGSVVPMWEALLAAGGQRLPVTDPDCTRFFMRMSEAVDLVLQGTTYYGDKLLIPTLPAYRLGDLATAMGAEIEICGLPSWEKKHEGMAVDNTSDQARRMTIDELKQELRT